MIAKVVGVIIWSLITPWIILIGILVFMRTDEGAAYWIGAGVAILVWLVYMGTVLWTLGNIQQRVGTTVIEKPDSQEV